MRKNEIKGVIEQVSPSKEQRADVLKKVNIFLKQLNLELKKQKTKASAVLGGSFAKDTWLSGDYDVDVFVKFDIKHKQENISDLLENALHFWKFERIHGSRDYFWVRNSVRYEIVPVLAIKKKSDAMNVTDFSPMHVEWVNKKGKKLKDDIRLIKQFCKASKCYGAESYIRGFSGHVVDILTIYYNGFLPFLRAASKWKDKTIIDYNNVHKGRAILILNTSKTQGPLIVIDPIQPERNAAAAVTAENYKKFIAAAKEFLKKPSESAFVEKQIDFEKLKKKGFLVKLAVKTLDDKEDVAGTKFVRAFEFVESKLSEFKVLKSGWIWDKKEAGVWWFVLKNKFLSDTFMREGPPLKFQSAVQNFKKAHKVTMIKNKRIFAKEKRKATTPKEVLDIVLQDEYVVSRVKSTNN